MSSANLSESVSSAVKWIPLHYIPQQGCPPVKVLPKWSETGQMLVMGILRRT